MAGKITLAAYSAAGCGGCEIALLEIHERILELVQAADIVFWPAIADFKYSDVEALPDASIDVCLFNGAIRTEENAHVAEVLRRKSKVLVAFGACASFGGVPGLGNLFDTAEMLERVYTTESTEPTTVRPRTCDNGEGACVTPMRDSVSALAGVTAIDYLVPGCAPEAGRVWEVCSAIIAGELPSESLTIGAGERSVCDECPREKRGVRVRAFVRPHQIVAEPEWCLLEQGVVCMGPATRSGCEARCPSAAMPCRGCYGPAGDAADQGTKMAAALGTIVDSEDEAQIVEIMAGVADAVGTFYCFSLPTSLMGGALPRTKDEGAKL